MWCQKALWAVVSIIGIDVLCSLRCTASFQRLGGAWGLAPGRVGVSEIWALPGAMLKTRL